MALDLKKIFATEGFTLPISLTLDMSDVDYFGGCPLKAPVVVDGSVSNRAGVVRLYLEIGFEVSAPCDRCGIDAANKHTIVIDKSLAVSIENEDSDTILTVPNMKLDVDELVFSEVILNMPTKHLCKEDCQGICVQCGKNLNDGKCDCNFKEIDPRLQKLADLLNN